MSEERLGFVGVVVEEKNSVPMVNAILSEFGSLIRGRMGVPDPERQEAVICLVVRGTTDQLGAMNGRLGNLPGVQVKSALTSSGREDGRAARGVAPKETATTAQSVKQSLEAKKEG